MPEKELSASALQIKEKQQRMRDMFDYAIRLTSEQLKEIIAQNPKANDSFIIDLVKREGIPKFGFIHSYIKNIHGVSWAIAKGYYTDFSQSLKPDFVEFAKGKFHLAERHIKEGLRIIKGAKKP